MAESNEKKNSSEASANLETKGEAMIETKVEAKVDDLPELSLEELDQLITQEDPEFAATLGEVAKGPFGNDILDDSEFKYTFEIEKKAWSQKKGFAAKIYKVFPPIALLSFLFFVAKNFLRGQFQLLKVRGILFIKEVRPASKRFLSRLSAQVKGMMNEFSEQFKSRSKSGKLIFISLILGSLVGAVLSVQILMKGLFPPPKPLFLKNLESYATEVISYDPVNEIESFYDSTKAVQNVFAIKRIVVNIRTSGNSGDNPMAAFEFIVEGNSTDAVIEVKDREAEIRDRFQRVIEEMTFDQLAGTEGKKNLTDTLRRSANQVLTKGKLRRVFIKTAIVKP